SGLARLNADGSVDAGFDPGTALSIGFPDFGPLTALTVLKNGQILVGGAFRTFNDQLRNGLARLNPNGSLDESFNPEIFQLGEGSPTISGFVVQEDDKIVLSGNFEGVGLEFRSGLVRINPDGTADPSFAPTSDSKAETYTVFGSQAGKIILFRHFTDSSGEARRAIARLNADGSFDPGLEVELAPALGTRLEVGDVVNEPNGGLLVAGNFSIPGATPLQGIVRVSPNGQPDPAFDPVLELAEGADSNVLAVAVESDNSLLVGGSFTRVNGVPRARLARVRADGSLDAAFAPVIESDQPQTYVAAIGVQGDGKILIGGVFTSVNGSDATSLARLNADGTLDSTFNLGAGLFDGDPATGGAVGAVNAIAVQPDGKVLVAGRFTLVNGQAVPYLGRLNTDGSVDTTFNSGVGVCLMCDPPHIRQLRLQSNGMVLVAGVFNRVDSFFMNSVARLQSTGAVDLAFMPTVGSQEQVSALAVGPGDQPIIAITTQETDGPRTRLMRFNTDGSVDAAFAPEAVAGDGSVPHPVTALATDSSGRLLIAGRFNRVGAAPRHGLARLNADGSLDAGFDLGAGFGNAVLPPASSGDPLVTVLVPHGNGGIVVGGNFGTVNDQVRLGLARVTADQGTPPTGGAVRLHSVSRAAGGAVTLMVSGEVGQTYSIEASSDLRTWTGVGTVTGAASPQAFTDDAATGMAQRFYRAVSP
ncbi:MAG TPA: delta-60 repeat domain-containing protein, partial [Prosthecobacter sp.]|nr:delta-60 repeat domain-containing protein [Prosthecobacter sp.]